MDLRAYSCINYVIKEGDTLYRISRDNNVPLALLLRVNPYADVYNLQIGDEICIPSLKPIAGTTIEYVVENGESLMDILNRFGLDMDDFLDYNDAGIMQIQPGTVLVIPTYDM